MWTAPFPSASLPLGGSPLLSAAEHSVACTATPETGICNHGPMITRFGDAFHLSWKKSPWNEDQDGQRVLYSASANGVAWSQPELALPAS